MADDKNLGTMGIMLKNIQLSVELMRHELKLNEDLVRKIYVNQEQTNSKLNDVGSKVDTLYAELRNLRTVPLATISHPEFKQEVCEETMALQPELLATQNIHGCDGYTDEKIGTVKPVHICLSADADLHEPKKHESVKTVHNPISDIAEFKDTKTDGTVEPVPIPLSAYTEIQDRKTDETVHPVHTDLSGDTETQDAKRDICNLSTDDNLDELPSVEECKKMYWWVTDDIRRGKTSRWPLTCSVCKNKLSRNVKQLHDHNSSHGHSQAVLDCDNLANLGRLLPMEVEKLAKHLGIPSRNIYILSRNQSKGVNRLFRLTKDIKDFFVSFVSHEGKLIELTIIGGGICISVVRSLLKGDLLTKFVKFLKHIFENANAEKVGKDLWFLMILLFKDFGVRSTNCYNIKKLELQERPVSVEVANPVISLVANARAVQ